VVRVPAEDGNFSLHHRDHSGSGAQATSFPERTRGSFAVGKATTL